jgi:putative nucleotidyltransferase with HDIG domain
MLEINQKASKLPKLTMPEIPTLDHKSVRKALSQKESLPTLPTTYTELIKVMGDPNATIVELSQIITHDPVLTANVLRVANSAFMGGGEEKIEDVSRAVFQLGIKEVGNIALSVGYFDVFASKAKGVSEDFLKNLWVHSAAVAMIGYKIANVGRFEFQKDAYLVGLLHDVGKLFFATSYTTVYAEIRSMISLGQAVGLTMEQDVFGLTHLDVGAELCQFWKMPDTVMHVATRHHDPASLPPESQPLGFCIAAANVFAHELIKDEPVDQRIGLAYEWLAAIAPGAAQPEQLTYENLAPLLASEVEKAKVVMSSTRKRRAATF